MSVVVMLRGVDRVSESGGERARERRRMWNVRRKRMSSVRNEDRAIVTVCNL